MSISWVDQSIDNLLEALGMQPLVRGPYAPVGSPATGGTDTGTGTLTSGTGGLLLDADSIAQQVTDNLRGSPHFSTADPATAAAHSQISMMLSQVLGIPTSVAGDYVNQWAQGVYDASSIPEIDADGQPTGNMTGGTWPDISTALQDPYFLAGASKIPTGASLFPSWFVIVESNGSLTFMDNRYSTGPLPIDAANAWGSIANTGDNRDLGLADIMGMPGNLPRYDRGTFDAIMAQYQPQTPSYGGGGGRGQIKFDKDQIVEATKNAWQTLLLDMPANPEDIADKYIAEATSFYYSGGSSLDFETWIKNRVRGTSRYAELYKRKPDWQSEEEFLSPYQNTVNQFGLRPETTKTETEIGATSGVGQADFARRLAGSREYQVGNLGALSRQFANMFSALGNVSRS